MMKKPYEPEDKFRLEMATAQPAPPTLTRGEWSNKIEFLLAVAGQIIGLGNVWRFPYLCYKNGGGVFFIPYILFLFTCGIPLFLLETSLGQYTKQGSITCWRKICPLFEGMGIGHQVVVLYSSIYYIIILAWAFFYLFSSFNSELPWASCRNSWNTDTCVEFDRKDDYLNWTVAANATSPVREFWEKRVLNITGSVHELGSIRWELALCLLLSWIICYFCVWKGVKSTGKIHPASAIHRYDHASPLLCLEDMWLFLIYGDCVYLCLLNSGTSFVAGFAIFSALGFMAYEQNTDISKVAESGPGLAFIAYPRAVAMMPFPQLWAVFFFIMIILLGLDSEFVGLEAIVTSISDTNPSFFHVGHRRKLLLLAISVFSFFVGLVMITEGTFVFSLIKYTPLKFNNTIEYPWWGYALGWWFTLSSTLMVPLIMLYRVCTTPGTLRQRFSFLCTPTEDLKLNRSGKKGLEMLKLTSSDGVVS
ncbi:hypothetical protein F7725_016978 [Dissostichus mawsoni]|uniref:Transporter n=1 Tax=Dissostichus mawsoni TaxID=36200 RepID=A0A7J5Z346_DISMA|nr:hypothetical protein F7725_016978 [Dissostichus mawsoni]